MIVALEHPALGPAKGRPPADSSLSDRERLATIFQATALLSHLEAAGWHLTGGWERARLGSRGALSGLAAASGRGGESAAALLLDLQRRLFGAALSGRGAARKLARQWGERWSLPLAPLALDLELARQASEAEFLLSEPWSGLRRALLAVQKDDRDGEILWIVGSPEARRRLLDRGATRESVLARLTGPEGVMLWADAASSDLSGTVLAAARRHFRAGRFERALRALGGEGSGESAEPSAEGELLRAVCHRHLGRFPASGASLRRLAGLAPSGETLADGVDLATVVYSNLGEAKEVERWLRLGRAGLSGGLAWRAEMAEAYAALDRDELAAGERHLAAARVAYGKGEAEWRLHRLAGDLALAGGATASAGAAFVEALRRGRRQMLPFEVGRLWVTLGNARSELGDLAGAERALAHAARLLGRCEGPIVTTLALHNLAEVRLRRGRLLGVEQIAAASEADNERQGHLRGWAHDQELAARLDLVRGQPERALTRVERALARLISAGQGWRLAELRVFAARALGWLGRADEAGEALRASTPEAIREVLEPEERPAAWALAGLADRAWAEARGGPFAALWRELLDGGDPPPLAWAALQQLDPYRAARLVYDCERLAPDCAPPAWQRQARSALYRVGAHRFAERIGREDAAVWRAVERFATRPPGEPSSIADLFVDAGDSGCRLTWEGRHDSRTLLDGEGGVEELAAPCGDGTLRLAGVRLGAAERALFALAWREYQPPSATSLDTSSSLIGESPELAAVRERITRLAAGEMPMLLLGESGTGKELAAREAHRASARRNGPFVAVNCAALSETLVHSDLFGHTRGAFTGADRDRAGVFETARGGTVFLDEIGDLPFATQGNLLRVLQEGEVRRLGESLPRKVDARIVAATHRDLAAMVREGTFRQDLFFRLRVATVRLPPLRERGRDVLRLAELFLARAAVDGTPARLSREAQAKLLAYSWPGNVRELQNVLTVARTLASDGRIAADHLELAVSAPVEDLPSGEYHVQIERIRRRLVEEAITASGGNQAEAARRLGLTRQTLFYLVRKLAIRVD